jgi:DNA-binding NarL/FixJ family response regulator
VKIHDDMFTTILKGEIYYSPDVSALLLRDKQNNDDNKSKEFTPREKEIANLVFDEYTNPEIAEKLFIDCRTVEKHKNSIMKKINVKTTAGLIKYLARNLFKFRK